MPIGVILCFGPALIVYGLTEWRKDDAKAKHRK